MNKQKDEKLSDDAIELVKFIKECVSEMIMDGYDYMDFSMKLKANDLLKSCNDTLNSRGKK